METSAVRTVFLNNHLVGIITTGAVIQTVLIFLWLYFFYVERLSYVRITAYYFFAAIVGLFADSIILFRELNGGVFALADRLTQVMNVSEALTIYSVYLLFSYFFKRRKYSEKAFLFGGYLSATAGILISDRDTQILSLYALIVFVVILYKSLKQMKSISLILVLLCGISAMAVYNVKVDGVLLIKYQWTWELLISIGFIFFYMSRYKVIIREKDDLLKRFSIDGLTGSASKANFMEQLSDTPKGRVFFVDINKFKRVNDLYGHAAGDRLLKGFSSYAGDRLIGLWSRFGGDEFTLLMTEGNEKMVDYAIEVLQDTFRRAVEDLELQNIEGLGISIGTVSFAQFKGYQALEAADAAMYRAKEMGNYLYIEGEVPI